MTLREATAVEPLGGSRYSARIGSDWDAMRGPNGGFLAALALSALRTALDDEQRAPRSLTLHYLRPPKVGPIELEVDVLRAGRALTTLALRMIQEGELQVTALAAFSAGFPSAVDYSAPMPEVTPWRDIVPAAHHPAQPPMAHRVHARPAVGTAPQDGGDPRSGGWLALSDAQPLDADALAFFSDAWMPTPFIVLRGLAPAPTVDLTIHFRVADPAAHAALGDPVLAIFESRASHDGFFDESGELWSADGVLLAQSRQHALLLARP